jgi:hypothetical protein
MQPSGEEAVQEEHLHRSISAAGHCERVVVVSPPIPCGQTMLHSHREHRRLDTLDFSTRAVVASVDSLRSPILNRAGLLSVTMSLNVHAAAKLELKLYPHHPPILHLDRGSLLEVHATSG